MTVRSEELRRGLPFSFSAKRIGGMRTNVLGFVLFVALAAIGSLAAWNPSASIDMQIAADTRNFINWSLRLVIPVLLSRSVPGRTSFHSETILGAK